MMESCGLFYKANGLKLPPNLVPGPLPAHTLKGYKVPL